MATGRASSFRFLPHGWYALLPTILTTLAWLASLFQDGCDYAKLSGPLVDHLTAGNVPWIEVGFSRYRIPEYDTTTDTWQTKYAGKCHEYSDIYVQQDPAWKAATGFAFLAIVIGGGGALFLCFSTCCVFSRGTWRWTGYEVLLAACFQVLAFLWFGTTMCQHPNTCELYWGSQTDIIATALWAVAALAIFCKYPIPHSYSGLDEPTAGPQRRTTTTQPELIVSPAESVRQGQEYEAAQRHSETVLEGLPLEGDAATMLPDKDLEVV